MKRLKKGIIVCLTTTLIVSTSLSGVYASSEKDYEIKNKEVASEALSELYEISDVQFARVSSDKVGITINTKAAHGSENFSIVVRGPGYMGSASINSRYYELELSNYGYYTIAITATDSMGNTDNTTKTLNFTAPLELTCNQSNTIVGINEEVALRANATGGEGYYKYKFTKVDDDKYEVIQDFDTNTTISIKLQDEGKYKILIDVIDSSGNTKQIEKFITSMDRGKDKPVIYSENKTMNLGETFNPLDEVTARDNFDGDITHKVNVIKNTVDSSKEGKYVVIYEVKDNDGNISTKEIDVIVVNKILDINGHWAEIQIKDFISNGYVNGKPDGKFYPDESITRAEFVKIFNRVFGLTQTSGVVFSDTVNNWAKDEIDIAVTNEVCQGTSETTFEPSRNITRQEASKMLANYMKLSDSDHDRMKQFPDYNNVALWARNELEAVIEKGYIKGCSDGTLSPLKNMSRAEAVVMLERIN